MNAAIGKMAEENTTTTESLVTEITTESNTVTVIGVIEIKKEVATDTTIDEDDIIAMNVVEAERDDTIVATTTVLRLPLHHDRPLLVQQLFTKAKTTRLLCHLLRLRPVLHCPLQTRMLHHHAIPLLPRPRHHRRPLRLPPPLLLLPLFFVFFSLVFFVVSPAALEPT